MKNGSSRLFLLPLALGGFVATARPAAAFTDVPPTYGFYTEITNIATRGITAGCGGGNYCPDALLTRAQMAVFVIRALHDPTYIPPAPGSQRYGDVPLSSPFAPYIEEMAVRGITGGCGGGNYCPDAFITREQMAVFVTVAAGVTNPPTPAVQRFDDVPPSSPYYRWIEQMAIRNVTAGCGGNSYCPTLSVSRAAMAAFIVRGIGLRDPGAPGAAPRDGARFLEQATWGPTPALQAQIEANGLKAYLDAQFATPATSYPDLPLQPSTIPATCDATCRRDNYSMYPLQRRFFTNAFYGPDQLRQRVAWALHKIIVVSGRDLQQPSWMVQYLKILERNAFGNFRTLLGEITLNPAMGTYLDMATSTRTNPNENYAREVLQLFTVGTEKLNRDGSVQRDANGDAIPTYDQAVVEGFTRVFTGWRLAPQPTPGVPNYLDPMVLVANNHEPGTKLLLNDIVLPANQPAATDLNQALDNIFNHSNVPPFISKQLIQQLVTSNPSPAYIERVAKVFENNGSGVRGDLKAVVEAILLDAEARGSSGGFVQYGRLKEPVQLIANVARAFDVHDAAGAGQSDGHLTPNSQNMDQDPLRPPTVFSYFPADWVVSNTGGLFGPEFGILSASTALRRANFVNTITFSNIPVSADAPNGTSIDLAPIQALAGNPNAMLDDLNARLMRSTMSQDMRNSILTAVNAVAATTPQKRARTAVYLVATSSQYQVQR